LVAYTAGCPTRASGIFAFLKPFKEAKAAFFQFVRQKEFNLLISLSFTADAQTICARGAGMWLMIDRNSTEEQPAF